MNFLRADAELVRDSWYAATAPRDVRFAALNESLSADVCVVGGGLAGLSAALELADRGYTVALLEARQIAWGASGRNGGQALAGLACEQTEIESQLGMDASRRVWAMTIEAVELIRERSRRFGIDADWQTGYLSFAVNARKANLLRRWQEHMLRHYGHATQWIPPADVPGWIASPRYHSGVFDPRSGHLHPMKYTLGLARAAAVAPGVRLFEGSEVTSIEPGDTTTLKTAGGEVRAKHVLLAGNVYLRGLAPSLARRIMPVGTYIAVSEPLGAERAASLIPSRAAVCDTNFVLDYFRTTPDDRLLYGGRVSYSSATPRDMEDSMRRRMLRTFPQLEGTQVQHAFGGFVDISMNRAPDFGRLGDVTGDDRQRNIYYLQGFSGHGLALTGLAGKLVAEAIAGTAERFDLFARLKHRAFPGGDWGRTPALVLAMAYYRFLDLF